jgi:serine/threonine protein kinase/tetratricopeptide (TPR) repeat protein
VNISREQIETLFHEALQRAPEERGEFLSNACGSDSQLHAELVSLLAHYENTGSTLLSPLIAPEFLLQLRSRVPNALIEAEELLAGRFRIIRSLASGGMGDVYEAEDTQLGDRIALKTIRGDVAANPRMLARFKKEIQLAKRVSHPNVCRIHDLGIHEGPFGTIVFLTMELLSGDTLAQHLNGNRLTMEETGRIAAQIAAGLDAAHKAGIVHRDLKTSNVILTRENSQLRIVITDFGIAHAADNRSPSSALTLTGEIVGTPDYMAPEQLRGEATSAVTDIYAFGLMLFEMVTGQKAFAAETPLAAALKRLHSPPPSPRLHVPELSQRWESAILRCLDPDPAARFQSAGDVMQFLETSPGSTVQRTHRAFRSRRLLLTILMILLMSTGVLILIGRYRHSHTETVSPHPVTNVPKPRDTAKIHYQRGLYFWNLRTQEAFLKAIDEYQQAIKADPKYALAYSGLAWVYAMQAGLKPPKLIFPEAKRYAQTAIKLDGRLAPAHAAIAFVRFYYDWDWKGAEEEFKTAITLDASYASAHSNYAILLAVRNRFPEAEDQAKLAEQADPVSGAVATGLGRIYSWSGDYQRAIQQFENVLSMHPQFLEAHLSLASALEQTGDSEGAVRQISYVLSDSLNSSALADLGYLYANMNDKQLARSMLHKIEDFRVEKKRYISPCYPAIVHAALGETDEAFRLLTQGLQERTFEMVYLNINREYSTLRQDRRWSSLVRNVGLME